MHSHPGHPAHPTHTAHLAHPAQRPPTPPSSPSPPSPLSSPSPLSPLSPGHQSTCGIFVCRGRGTECSERLISSKSVVHCFTQCTGSFFFSGWCFCSFCCLFGLTDHRRFDDCQSLERAQKKIDVFEQHRQNTNCVDFGGRRAREVISLFFAPKRQEHGRCRPLCNWRPDLQQASATIQAFWLSS